MVCPCSVQGMRIPHDDPIGQLWLYGDVAEFLRVPERTLRRWVASGAGPRPLRLGRSVRFRPADVAAWLDEKAAA